MNPEQRSFHALGERLLREAFPAIDRETVEAYLRRTDTRIRQAAEQPNLPAPAGLSGPVVLIVDDVDDLRDILARMLQRRDFRTLEATTAGEALQICRAYPDTIDFVVTDLGLPGVTDAEFRNAMSAFRVVFLSGLPRDLALANRMITPGDLLVKKPFGTEALLDALHTAALAPTKRPS